MAQCEARPVSQLPICKGTIFQWPNLPGPNLPVKGQIEPLNMWGPICLEPECDVSVSKLLGFETFLFVLVVSDSVSEKFGIERSIGLGIVKIWYRKKYRIR